MNRIRRPWTIHRQNTDGVQLNILDETGKKQTGREEELGDGDKAGAHDDVRPVDVAEGHIQEIEVDVAHVLKDNEVKDVDADTSPYPEVVC